MQFRSAGKTGVRLSVVGLGTWAMGGAAWKFGWGDQDDNLSVSTIHAALECGINWIDTAAVYGLGHSEEVVGQALKQLPHRQRPFVATKCGRVATNSGDIVGCLKRDSIIAECEASLRRLQTDCIDLYQLHWPDPDEDIEEGWQALVELKRQGKVRFIGVSNHNVPQMERLQRIHPVATLQPPYSLIARQIEAEIIPWCHQHSVGVLCYSPMGKGLLTGGISRDRIARLPETDHRRRDPRFQPPQLEINLAFVERLKSIADAAGWSLPELAIAWVLRRPEITSAIVGARRPEQIRQTAGAGDRIMTEDMEQAIAEVLRQRDADLASLGDLPSARV